MILMIKEKTHHFVASQRALFPTSTASQSKLQRHKQERKYSEKKEIWKGVPFRLEHTCFLQQNQDGNK